MRKVIAAVEVDSVPARLWRSASVSERIPKRGLEASRRTGKRISPRRPFGQLYGGRYGWRVCATSAPRLPETEARSAVFRHDARAFPRDEPVPTDGFRRQGTLIRAPERVARQHAETVRERGDVGRVGGVVALEVINEEAGADPLYGGERAVRPLEVAARKFESARHFDTRSGVREELTVEASSNLTCSERSASSDRLCVHEIIQLTSPA